MFLCSSVSFSHFLLFTSSSSSAYSPSTFKFANCIPPHPPLSLKEVKTHSGFKFSRTKAFTKVSASSYSKLRLKSELRKGEVFSVINCCYITPNFLSGLPLPTVFLLLQLFQLLQFGFGVVDGAGIYLFHQCRRQFSYFRCTFLFIFLCVCVLCFC